MKVQVAEKFRIRTQKGEIELTPGQVIALTEEKAAILLKTGRVVPIIQEDLTNTFQGLFEKAVDETAAVYRHGCLETTRDDFPDLAKEIQAVECQINLQWLKAREGIGDLGIFKESVERWRSLHFKAIVEYHNSKHPSLKAVSKLKRENTENNVENMDLFMMFGMS